MIKQREGLSSRPLTSNEVQQKVADRNSPAAGDKWWTVEYSKRYKGVTKTFMQAVMTGGSRFFIAPFVILTLIRS